jgi:hypothetical protein
LLGAVARVGEEDDWLGGGVGPGEEAGEFFLNVVGRGGSANGWKLVAVREPADLFGGNVCLVSEKVVPALGVIDGALEVVRGVLVGG